MSADRPLRSWRVGIIGCGEWGPNHIRNFLALPEAEVVGAADTRADRRARVEAQTPGVPVFESAAALLDTARPDAVVIATPTATHAALVREALEAGVHVLCEKPLCLTPSEAEALVALADRRRRCLMVGHVFLYNRGILKLKDVVDQGELGGVRYLSSRRTNLGPVRSDVNAVLDLASHDIAIFNYLIGTPPVEVSAVGQAFLQPDVEDVAFITLRYPGDVLAAIQVSWLDPKKVREITVVGEARMAIWDDLAPLGPVTLFDKRIAPREYSDFGEFQLRAREGDVTIPRVLRDEPLRLQARAFLEALDGQPCRSDGRVGVEVVRVLAAVNASLARRGQPVPVERPAAVFHD